DAVVDIYYRADEPAIVEGKEEKTITRTINVHLPNGEVQTIRQPVTLERKYTSVAGSDEKKYGPWTVGRWESFTAPEQEGYTAIPGTVDGVEVTSESLDAVVDIYYRADEPAIVEGKEEKTITRTINVHLPNGEVQTTKQPVTLERKYTSVAGSDEKKYGPWTVGRWESFTAPEQEGYTAIPGTVDEVEVTSESLDAVVDIYYRADEPAIVEGKEEKTITRTINVHLLNGEVQTTKQPVTLERKYTSVAGSDEKKYGPWTVGRWESFTAPEQEGYTAIPGTVDEVEVTSESLDAVVDIYYRADEPAIVEGKEEKTITRTINVHLPNGEVQTTRQPVTLERKYTSVAGSDEKKYGPWTVGRWESFTAPEQEGYTAIPGAVDEVEVTSESLDAVVDIYYRADEPAIVEESEEVTDDPTPETSTTSPTPKNITNAKGKTATPELKNMDTKSKVFQNKLPQTGNKVETIYSIIGLLLTSILGVWEIIRKR
ncbi:LPXTG cell wall anchor domain-containing protein, partial [Ligilactobacillus salivarius]|uniref:LPXTG cell wall anchor domain-containing protein n=1 Tax=Ligilactobacillus salivarius TaxID=1624 RepID=UPI00117AE72C